MRTALTIRAILARVGGALGYPWFQRVKPPEPTARDLWRAARIEHAQALARGDTRAVGRARKNVQRWAHADLASTSPRKSPTNARSGATA